MTVIAWDGKTLASDSMASSPEIGEFSHFTKKLFRLSGGSLLGTAGDADARDVIKLLNPVTTEADFPERKVLVETRTEFDGLLILPSKKAFNVGIYIRDDTFDVWGAYFLEVPSRYATGHGAPYAMVALDIGQSAEQAVKAAIKRSLFCGGPVQTLALEAKPKEKKPRVRKLIPVNEEQPKDLKIDE